jgi:hypothetical protein
VADYIRIYVASGSLEISPTAERGFDLRLERDPDREHPSGSSEVLATGLVADQVVERVREAVARTVASREGAK